MKRPTSPIAVASHLKRDAPNERIEGTQRPTKMASSWAAREPERHREDERSERCDENRNGARKRMVRCSITYYSSVCPSDQVWHSACLQDPWDICPGYVLDTDRITQWMRSPSSNSNAPTERLSRTAISSGTLPSCTSRGTPAETSAVPTFAVSWRPFPRSRQRPDGWSSSHPRMPREPRRGVTSFARQRRRVADPERALYRALGARRPKPTLGTAAPRCRRGGPSAPCRRAREL